MPVICICITVIHVCVHLHVHLHVHLFTHLQVRVELKEHSSVCSAAHKKGWFEQEVQVGPETTRSVPFVIIPMKGPEATIEIKAAVKNSYHGDGIIRTLRVVVRGMDVLL